MITKVFLNHQHNIKNWDEFVTANPKGTPFHLSNWIQTIQETFAFKPLIYISKNEREEIEGIFPFFLIENIFYQPRIVSLPYSDYGGPLLSDSNSDNEFIEHIIEKAEMKNNNIEIRGSILKKSKFCCHNYFKRHVLCLSSNPQEVKNKIDKRTIQYSIRKAERVGVIIREENSYCGIQEFYRLHVLTRKKHGVPCPPFKFFKNLFEKMVLKGIASILLAFYNLKVIAAGIFFKSKETVYYKYNASDSQYLSHYTPNHLLTWHAIKQACLNGYLYFDFGRTAPDNEGLMRYKEMWGAKAMDLPYYYYPQITGATSNEEKKVSYRVMTGIWRSMPKPVTQILGPSLYRYMA